MSKIRIDKNDKNRVLLTELLPYEVPMLFSNDGFYTIVSKNSHDYFVRRLKSIKKSSTYGIPYDYEITKSFSKDTRRLSIIHPINQLEFIEFYSKYELLLLHLCSKSPFSLRRISKVANYCYSPDMVIEDEDILQNAESEVEPDIKEGETKIFKSYFTYYPIDLIYKFFERNEYQRLEQRFDLLMEFDISKCFYNIYTHSITWAVKDKVSAKRNAGKNSFENRFDKIMQLANYNETNGIVVGPEVSRIFAEIILQQIDINVLNRLELIPLKHGIDYEIKRYVDDYFIFSNDESTLDTILKFYKTALEEYKLYLNTSKTAIRHAPFITNITVGKRELKKMMSDFFDAIFEPNDDETAILIKHISRPYSVAQDFIKDFQCIIKRNDLTYDVLNKEIIRFFKHRLVKVLREDNFSKERETFQNFLLLFLDIIFYAYSLNINSSATYKMAQVIVLIVKYFQDKEDDYKHAIFSKIYKEADFVITNFQRKSKRTETNIETLNLLIALKKLGSNYTFSEKRLRDLFRLKISAAEDNEPQFDLNYFEIITLIYYFGANSDFASLRSEIETVVLRKYDKDEDPFSKAELTCLFFDFVCCPYVSEYSKKTIMRKSGYSQNSATFAAEIAKIADEKMWFMNWDSDIDLERVLKKKEFGSSY